MNYRLNRVKNKLTSNSTRKIDKLSLLINRLREYGYDHVLSYSQDRLYIKRSIFDNRKNLKDVLGELKDLGIIFEEV